MRFKDRGVASYVIILIAGAVLAALAAAIILYWHSTSSRPAPGTGQRLNDEQKVYLPLLEFTDARMSAAENFLGDRVTYLEARVTNRGTRVVRRLVVELKFADMLNQVVLREAARPVTERTPPLQPGETRAFRVPLEHMPADWNQAPPAITPTFVQF